MYFFENFRGDSMKISLDQGSFCVCAQPMGDDVTLQHHLSLVERVHKTVTAGSMAPTDRKINTVSGNGSGYNELNHSTWMYPYSKSNITFILMAQCKTAVTPLLTYWSYSSLALSHRYNSPCYISRKKLTGLPTSLQHNCLMAVMQF